VNDSKLRQRNSRRELRVHIKKLFEWSQQAVALAEGMLPDGGLLLRKARRLFKMGRQYARGVVEVK
jgi:hypothetical protein